MFISFSHEKDLLRLIESNVMSGRRCHLKRREKEKVPSLFLAMMMLIREYILHASISFLINRLSIIIFEFSQSATFG